MDIEQVREAAGRTLRGIHAVSDAEAIARFAAAMLDTEALPEGVKSSCVINKNVETRGQLAALRLALGLPLTAGGENDK